MRKIDIISNQKKAWNVILSMHRIKVIKGDITSIAVDAIVNAANSSLMGGGGVDGAIHRAGGPAILEDCRKIVAKQGGCKTGAAVITGAGRLPAKYVIHTVGPVYNSGKGKVAELLASCYQESLKLAVANHCKTIAFPSISTGIYGYPKAQAAVIAMDTVKTFLAEDHEIEEVVFVCFDDENYDLLKKESG
ncbi:O-acetyl-ADP-ribose deacetylase (regulator of RNase III), contains Macro domain [Pedobacter nyackensis]|uniref:O-acetyl-ADP-ribose deacetylase (Regulator of RNase III), contains Macro domain n=2 Tax=Pedobacter nyackensis TaxID=475255 RepID=A0A1W2ANN5_9SPHI|nr:O-acetyl-ADP-ribose deacetylase (regulator of RNase III), contains Macro domain [Pedobacter nyackensis]